MLRMSLGRNINPVYGFEPGLRLSVYEVRAEETGVLPRLFCIKRTFLFCDDFTGQREITRGHIMNPDHTEQRHFA